MLKRFAGNSTGTVEHMISAAACYLRSRSRPAQTNRLRAPTSVVANETSAVRLPSADGVKVTVMVQLAPALTLVPQVLVSVKSLAFVPVIVMLVMLTATLALLLRVIFLATLLVLTG
jgi:hypothetical protein